MKTYRGTLYYDGTCSFCIEWIDRIGPYLSEKNIAVYPFSDGPLEPEMKLHWHDGRILGGADAAFFLARCFFWLWPIGALGAMWGVRDLGRMVYRRIAAKRHCRGRKDGTCELHVQDPTPENRKRAVIAGGSGFLGKALAKKLEEQGWEAIILTRKPSAYSGDGKAVYWDGKRLDPSWLHYFEGADALINLAGKNVNCRPGKRNRETVLRSRVDSVRVLGEALREIRQAPPVWIQASSLAIYGDGKDRIINESGFVPPEDYPVNVCVAWEEELGRAVLPGMRWAILRIGFVLGKEGGALPFLVNLTRRGLGGSIGNGEQWISWIHLDDILSVFLEAINAQEMEGIYNVTGLQPVTNAEFMRTLREVLNRPWSPPAPSFAVKIGAPILNADPQIALTGRRCLPLRLHESGFSFAYQELEDALTDLLKQPREVAPNLELHKQET